MLNHDEESALIHDIAAFDKDPYKFTMYAYPWGEGELKGMSGPRVWQKDTLIEIRDHLSNPETRFTPLLISRASGHGIGKSAIIGFISNWAMSTCSDCKIVTTANTENQLRTKTVPEVTKWFNLAINSHWFNKTATAIYSNDEEHDRSWRQDFIPWSENNTEAFAGLHNQGKRIVLIFDEASNIADKVWEVAEGALTDEETEIIWIAFGNPTRNTGRFRECFRKFRHRWKTKQIDSRTVEGVNTEQIQKWVDDYGEDSDFVKVRVRGIFPSASENQFIPQKLVDDALSRVVLEREISHAATIIGVDPAYSGGDETVFYLRRGLFAKIIFTGVGITDHITLASRLAQLEDEHQADAVFIDYGYGMTLKNTGDNWGRNWQLINFGGESNDPQMLNKRGEMYADCRKWLKDGGSIDDQQTADELIMPEYHVQLKSSKQVLESKQDIKKKFGISPGRADALALTFAAPVIKRDMANSRYNNNQGSYSQEYDRESL